MTYVYVHKVILVHLSVRLIYCSSSNCLHMLPVGDSNKEPGSVRFGACSCGQRFAAQSPGQLCLTTHPWIQGQSPGSDTRQPDSSSWQFAPRFVT